jgi:allantoinase
MSADLVITSRRIVTPTGMVHGAVVVTDGVISEVAADSDGPDARRRVDAGDAAVLPGVVDTHVHVNEPGRTEWEGFETATRAAAAGGITTIVDMPLNSVPVTTTVDALRAKARAADGRARVDYGFWGGVVPGNTSDLRPLVAAGALGFKCFLVPSGIDEFAHVDRRVLREAMPILADLGVVLLAHAELPGPIERAGRTLASGDPRRYATFLTSRPPAAELEAIDLLLGLSRETGCPVHIVHLSAADGATRIAAARAADVRATVETCPHYLTFAAEEIPDGATVFKCAPPIREAANREALWRALADDTIHLVASDHSPAVPDLKCLDAGDFMRAWGGVASLQLSLPATWTAARDRGHTPADVARWMAERPAALAGLGRHKGRIAAGYDADLVILDPDARFTVDAGRLHHRHPVTPYDGRPLHGVVRRTFVRGVCVFDDGVFAPSRPHGRPVNAQRS